MSQTEYPGDLLTGVAAPLTEHVIVFDVVTEGTRMWAWCVVDLSKGYGWARVNWTSPGGAEDLPGLPASLDWTVGRGGSAPTPIFDFDIPMLDDRP